MSHLTVYKTSINNINKQLLIRAIQCLAKEIGATTKNYIVNYGGRRISVDIALHNNLLSGYSNQGIGFRVTADNKLEVVGDPYMHENEYNRVKSLATNYIQAYQVASNARNNYNIKNIQLKTCQKDVVMEVIYA